MLAINSRHFIRKNLSYCIEIRTKYCLINVSMIHFTLNSWRKYCCHCVFHSFICNKLWTKFNVFTFTCRTRNYSHHNMNDIWTNVYNIPTLEYEYILIKYTHTTNYINYSSDEPNACFWPFNATLFYSVYSSCLQVLTVVPLYDYFCSHKMHTWQAVALVCGYLWLFEFNHIFV